MAKPKSQESKGAIQVLEEGVELLRRAPLSALAAYYLGSVPFGLGFLYFWADMSRSSQADETLPQGALVLALLFVWMKTWQSIFTQALWTGLTHGIQAPWTPGRILRAVLTQATLQPWGFLAIPLTIIFNVPFINIPLIWVYAFFQNVTVLGSGTEDGLSSTWKKSWKLALAGAKRNNVMRHCVNFLRIFIFFNLLAVLALGPHFLKAFLGIETVFSRAPWSLMNTTFFAVVLVLTYLCLDPLVKAVYTLSCFYGESLSDGEDLKVELKMAAWAKTTFLFLALSAFTVAGAQEATSSNGGFKATASVQASSLVPPGELDKSITEALRGEEYQWHLPRVTPPHVETEKEPGLVSKFLEGAFRLVVRVLKKVGHWIVAVIQWLQDHLKFHPSPDRQVKSSEWDFEWLYLFLWALLALAACALGLLVYRLWTRREKLVVLGEAVMPKPDIADEKVTGIELPMDGWLQMAQDLLRQGNFRLALRAFYLASLAALARQKLVTLAKSKSTLDYDRELRRRGHSLPGLLPIFSESGSLFDRGWYGSGDVTREMVEAFAVHHAKIQKAVETPLDGRTHG